MRTGPIVFTLIGLTAGFHVQVPYHMRARLCDPVMVTAGDSVLLIQNKGGGHGEIGYHLALNLVKEKGMGVTILHEGPNKGKPPHASYGDLEEAGVKVLWVDSPADADAPALLDGKSFSVVIDNWSSASAIASMH